MKLYHGSKTSNIKVLRPSAHTIVNDKGVVFATPDRSYAISMIFRTGNDLAVSYHNDKLYVDEIKPGALKLLDGPGSLYELDQADFEPSPEGLEGEYVSFNPAPVVAETKIPNLLKELKKLGAHLVAYEDVPSSMKTRGLDPNKPKLEHSKDRFS